MHWISLFEHGSPRTRARFSENQSAPKLENRKTPPCSPRAPNLLHVLPSRMVGWNELCNPVYRICLTPFIEYVYHFFIEYLWHLLLKNIAKASHISKNWNFCRLSNYVTEVYNHNLTFLRRQQCTHPNSCIRGARARALSVARPVTTISAPLEVWVVICW